MEAYDKTYLVIFGKDSGTYSQGNAVHVFHVCLQQGHSHLSGCLTQKECFPKSHAQQSILLANSRLVISATLLTSDLTYRISTDNQMVAIREPACHHTTLGVPTSLGMLPMNDFNRILSLGHLNS